MSDQLLTIVRGFSRLIRNGRSLRSVVEYGKDELEKELIPEVENVERGVPEGKDGVVGEAIDVILCMLDAIFVHCPEITDERILQIAQAKCQKWADNVTLAESPAD